jgi:hypothetical protein
VGRAEDAGQQPHVTSARVEPGENGQSAAAPADAGGAEPGRSPAFRPVTEDDVAALEESVCEEDYDSPRQQAIAGNVARREEDRELIAKLAKSNFEGPGQELFEAEMAAYGYPVMMAWTRTGEIVKKTAGISRPLSIPSSGLGWSREDRSELSTETVARAVNFFREKVLRAGTWDHTRGATIKTYFVGACLFQFPNVYQVWQAERRRWNSRPAVSIDDPGAPGLVSQMPSDDDTEHRVIARDQLQQVMAELADKYPDLHEVVMMQLDGHTDAQAAQRLGMTPRAVEGRWRRFRRGHRHRGSGGRPA